MAEIILDNEKFTILDEIEYVTLADSFVFIKKKATTGHGEARLYVGPQNEQTRNFFSDFGIRCFFLRADLESYMNDAKTEYEKQEQRYRKDISDLWEKFMDDIRMMEKRIYFSIENATGKEDTNRFYIRSPEKGVYKLMRQIALPTISYLTILKLKSEKDGKFYYYFRLFLDYYYTPASHPSVINEEKEKIEKKKIPKTEKLQLMMARIGQGIFRDGLLKESPMCPITQVTDERILIASHIKPWAVSDTDEKLDPKNGLLLTPTYDWLFGRGFISFEDDGTLLVSPYISPLNIKKLNLVPKKKYPIPAKGREKYLKYHRENIFKK